MTVPRVKICGITCLEDALAAVDAGADALGFVFAESPRHVEPDTAAAIVARLPPFVTTVALVVDQDPGPILAVCPCDVVQYHGEEAPEVLAVAPRRAIKAFRVRDAADLAGLDRYPDLSAYLLDAYVPGLAGGTGNRFPWELAVAAARPGRRIIVAGGLNARNVGACVRRTRPYGVDVASGVEERPGKKSAGDVAAFIRAVHRAAVDG